MRPPMAMDPRFRMMHPGMMQRMNPMMMNRHPLWDHKKIYITIFLKKNF